nr:MAG TPA: hypothetical protein [Caudoviricetes sp.]
MPVFSKYFSKVIKLLLTVCFIYRLIITYRNILSIPFIGQGRFCLSKTALK